MIAPQEGSSGDFSRAGGEEKNGDSVLWKPGKAEAKPFEIRLRRFEYAQQDYCGWDQARKTQVRE